MTYYNGQTQMREFSYPSKTHTQLVSFIFVVFKDLEISLSKHGQIEAIYSPVFPGLNFP